MILSGPKAFELTWATAPEFATIGGVSAGTHADLTRAYALKRAEGFPAVERFEVHRGDQAPGVDDGKTTLDRCERLGIDLWPEETEIWQYGAVFIEPDARPTGAWNIVCQWHQDLLIGSPAWSLQWDGTNFFIDVRTSTQNPLVDNPPAIITTLGPGQAGRWYNFVFRFVYSQTIGQLEVHMDGVQVMNYSGPIGYIDNGIYPKWGIYRGRATEREAVRWANMQFSLSSLAAYRANPPAIY